MHIYMVQDVILQVIIVLFCSLRVSMWTLISSSGSFKFSLHNCIQTILFAMFSISVAGSLAFIIVKCKQVITGSSFM